MSDQLCRQRLVVFVLFLLPILRPLPVLEGKSPQLRAIPEKRGINAVSLADCMYMICQACDAPPLDALLVRRVIVGLADPLYRLGEGVGVAGGRLGFLDFNENPTGIAMRSKAVLLPAWCGQGGSADEVS